MAKKIFISFDYDYDRDHRYLLRALVNNPRSDINFLDVTPDEIQSYDISRIKAVLTDRIRKSTHVLVIIGSHANSYHPDRDKIGQRNWQWWEIEKGAEEAKQFIAVKISPTNEPPEPLYGKEATWAYSFKVESIVQAIDEA